MDCIVGFTLVATAICAIASALQICDWLRERRNKKKGLQLEAVERPSAHHDLIHSEPDGSGSVQQALQPIEMESQKE